jgi:hypothetical protein
MKAPCKTCGKQIAHGWGLSILAPLICTDCLLKNPKLLAKLKPEDRKKLQHIIEENR